MSDLFKENYKQAQTKLTALFFQFDLFCTKYNVRYWCVCNTFLNLIRHQGWSQWNSELSVGIVAEDYAILLEYQKELPSTMSLFVESDGVSRIRDLYSSYSTNNGNDHSGLKLTIYPYSIQDGFVFDKYLGFKHSYDSIFPLQKRAFDTIEVRVPNKIEQICIDTYGSLTNAFSIDDTVRQENIDPINASVNSVNTYSELYSEKTQQWFSRIAKIQTIPLHHASGWSYLDQENWNELCEHCLHSIDISSIQNMFDAGCGVGALIQYMKNKGRGNISKIQFHGCDICEESVQRCLQQFPDANITSDSMCDLSRWESNSFNYICSISAISYLDSLDMVKKAVKELIRIAKPGALLSLCIVTDNQKTMKSFTVLIPKQWWAEQSFEVSSMVLEDMTVKNFHGRYSVFMVK